MHYSNRPHIRWRAARVVALLACFGSVALGSACGGQTELDPRPRDGGLDTLDTGVDGADGGFDSGVTFASPNPNELCRNEATRNLLITRCLSTGTSCGCFVVRPYKGCDSDRDCPSSQRCFSVNPKNCDPGQCGGPGESNYTPFGICWNIQ